MMIAESVNGTFRELSLNSSVGPVRAKQISFVVGAAIILSLAIIFIRWIGTAGRLQLAAIGILWAVLTVGFDFFLGLFVFGYPLERVIGEFDPRTGSLMPLGVILLLLAPFFSAWVRGTAQTA
jgi:hypothetical protein